MGQFDPLRSLSPSLKETPPPAPPPDKISPLVAVTYPSELPITALRDEIIEAILRHQVLVITGETGSGKSTQIPKMCLDAGRGQRGRIGCTQPRRLAAVTLAQRVAEEMGKDAPSLVGYKIRFQDRTSRSTRIKFMTDGILLAEAQKDRLFRAYDTLIIDEAHERSLNIDFLLGLLKGLLPRRPDLKLIITSATIDPEKFSRAFGDAPIINVSGRLYPVEVRTQPLTAANSDGDDETDEDDVTYIDAAVAAVDDLKTRRNEGPRGDILIFMPTESDIRETSARIEEKRYPNTLVMPLFGRLAAADQARVFRSTPEEKIIVATNVAETSLTIPGIRYVIDTGLARMAQYNARTGTQGLPVVPISQASADQRKGRCGRVASGVCIRLYSEEDYLARPAFTPPEIQRSNLAEVILRMLDLRLGNIQEFPFLDPPSPTAVKDGFTVLRELGSVDDHRRLTPIGRLMARLPLDPRLARMLIQARQEGAVREMIILAAALSIQDPRERPADKETQADQAHARFRDPRSDFVTLLRLHHACWGDGTAPPPSRSVLRRFCRDNFLSERRMREWRDIQEEITNILAELDGFAINEAPASYEAIHRSVLSGYLSHIALRKEKNIYTAARNRQAMIFPGSGLFNKSGAWIVAAELVHTSRLFARSVAQIEPEWLEKLGRHLCRSSYSEPHWERRRGNVVAFERVTLYGLTIVEQRKIDYGRVHPAEARTIFIRSALVDGDLPKSYPFIEHNQALIRRIDELECKARRRDLLVDEETLFQFYDARLPELYDLRSFEKFLKDQGGDALLRMTEADLLRAEPDFQTLEEFPDILALGDVTLPLRYAFRPGTEEDGVTAVVPLHVLPRLRSEPFEWLVPGLLPEKIVTLLKALPKGTRRRLVPVGETAQRLLRSLSFGEGSLSVALSRGVEEVAGVSVPPASWDWESLPPYLRMRYEVVSGDGQVLGAGRDIEALRVLTGKRHEDRLWDEARRRWERTGLTRWDFGDVPERIDLGQDALGMIRYAYPGLVAEGGTAGLRLFMDPDEARRQSLTGLATLYELLLGADLRQLRRAWAFPDSMASLTFFAGGLSKASPALQMYVVRELLGLWQPQHPDRRRFEERVAALRGRMGTLAQEIVGEVLDVVREREAVREFLERTRSLAGRNAAVIERMRLLKAEMERLVPPDFLGKTPRDTMRELPRYLKALRLRAERAYTAPEKDRQKEQQILPYGERLEAMLAGVSEAAGEEGFALVDEFRLMLEELKISVFAPEIKTRHRISPKRLDEKWQEWTSCKSKRA